jgi:hypothetical protein
MNNKTMTELGLYYGNVPGRVKDVLLFCCNKLPIYRLASVLSLDSNRFANDILRVLLKYDINAYIERNYVFISPEELYRTVINDKLFVGFDVVLLFAKNCPEKAIPTYMEFTSESMNYCRELPDGIDRWMKDNSCVLVLGDGCGLNYATWSNDLAICIESGDPALS